MKMAHSKVRNGKRQRGFSLIEMMIAMVVLAVGLGALTILFTTAMYTNTKSNKDTTATMLAQTVMEQIDAQSTNGAANFNITDCQGTAWLVNMTPGAAPNGAGATLLPVASNTLYGSIDPNQAYAAVPAGYAMQYVHCGANSQQTIFDVRWNIMSANSNARLVTVQARQDSRANSLGGKVFAYPVTLRGMSGQ